MTILASTASVASGIFTTVGLVVIGALAGLRNRRRRGN